MKPNYFILIVLALGMFSIKGNAQKKEYKIGLDGFEWYELRNSEGKYGIEDKFGKTIIPTIYDFIFYYDKEDKISTGFSVTKDGYDGWYNKSGKCIISYTRHYKAVLKLDDKEWGTYYWVTKDEGSGICDINGREIVFIRGAGNVYPRKKKFGNKMLYYFAIDKKGNIGHNDDWGVADANGNIVVATEHKQLSDDLIFRKVKTTNNPLKGNRSETIAESEGQHLNTNDSSTPSSSLSSNSNNNNSGNNTTTIHVEHHRDPVPVQEWHACWACGGMGTMGCDGCGGSGTKHYGDRLRRCGRCNGQGLIPCNVCYGNKGQYVTVYK